MGFNLVFAVTQRTATRSISLQLLHRPIKRFLLRSMEARRHRVLPSEHPFQVKLPPDPLCEAMVIVECVMLTVTQESSVDFGCCQERGSLAGLSSRRFTLLRWRRRCRFWDRIRLQESSAHAAKRLDRRVAAAPIPSSDGNSM